MARWFGEDESTKSEDLFMMFVDMLKNVRAEFIEQQDRALKAKALPALPLKVKTKESTSKGEVAVVPGLGAINPGALRPTPRASDKKNEDDKIDVQWSAKSPLKPVPPKIPRPGGVLEEDDEKPEVSMLEMMKKRREVRQQAGLLNRAMGVSPRTSFIAPTITFSSPSAAKAANPDAIKAIREMKAKAKAEPETAKDYKVSSSSPSPSATAPPLAQEPRATPVVFSVLSNSLVDDDETDDSNTETDNETDDSV